MTKAKRKKVAAGKEVASFEKILEFPLQPLELHWPWVAFSPGRDAFAYPTAACAYAVRAERSLDDVRRLVLPEALAVPADEAGTFQAGLRAAALHPDGATLVGVGWQDGPALFVTGVSRSPRVVSLARVLGEMVPRTVAFTKDGAALWVSAEEEDEEAVVARLDFATLRLLGKVAFPAAPAPAQHLLHLHPTEDAAMLLMNCGQDGTFCRVARATGGEVTLLANEGEDGLEPSGLVEMATDGRNICLASSDQVELRRWPDLSLEAAFELDEDVVTNYAGVRVGERILVETESEDAERCLVFEKSLRFLGDAPRPPGMWAGRLGTRHLVTVSHGIKPPVGSVFALQVDQRSR